MKVLRNGKMPPEDAGSLSDRERNDGIESLHMALMEHSATGGTALRRLTRTEYEHTVRKVFGIDFETPDGFPSDESVHGFNNMAEGLVISAPLMEAYFQSAIAVADRIVPPPRPPEPSTCTTIAADELVISYSSGAIIDGAMRLAAKTDTMWRSSTWPEKYEVRSAGTYRIRVSASRFAPGSDAWPEFESVVELYASETPVFDFANAPIDGVKGEQEPLADTLRTMFDNDPRLLAGWLQVEHGRGLRGGVGWDRVKQIRDSDDLDLDAVQRACFPTTSPVQEPSSSTM